MSTAPSAPVVTCDGVSFDWPDGTPALNGVSGSFDAARTGLIGDNGSGKSTLLRLVAGDLTPTHGSIRVAGTIGYLPQDLALQGSLTIAAVLGVDTVLAALARVEEGCGSDADFETIGTDWDLAERTHATMSSLGLSEIALDRTVDSVSGGELTLIALAGLLLSRPDVLLLDEPTNNLDVRARARLYDAIEAWRGVLIMVSHDREALRRVDAIVELRDGVLRTYGGNFDHYSAAVTAEQEAAERGVRDAKSTVAKQHREWVDAQVKLARRKRFADRAEREKRVPKIVAGNRKREAQVSAGKLKNAHRDDLAAARDSLAAAELRLRDDDEITIELPRTAVPSARLIVELPDLIVKGPERIALTGPNGAGKTTLLREIAAHALVPHGYLTQRLDMFDDDDESLIANIARIAPQVPTADARNRLAQFLLRGRHVELPAGALSGGQRLRAALAALLMNDPQLLLLDEPTNNLDLASVRHLCAAMRAFRAALIVVSHDRDFLADLDLSREITLPSRTP